MDELLEGYSVLRVLRVLRVLMVLMVARVDDFGKDWMTLLLEQNVVLQRLLHDDVEYIAVGRNLLRWE